MKPLNEAYEQVRSKICNAYLVAISIVAVPTLAASLFRAVNIGWQPVMGLHVVMAVLLILITFFRERISYHIRVGFLIFFFIIIGLAGIWSFGLVAGGVPFLLVAPILAAIFLTIRDGVLLMVGIIIASAAIGASIVLGYRMPAIDAGPYVMSAPAWIVTIAAWVLTNGSLVLAVGFLNRFLLESLQTAQSHAQALEENEAQYRRLIHNLPEIVYSRAPATSGLFYSPRVKNILGYSPEHLIRHPRLWDDSIHPDDVATTDQAIAELKDGKRFDLVYRIRDAKGDWHWFHDRCTDIRRYGGEIVVDGIVTDITAQRQAEEQLRQSQKMEAIGQLTGGIAHDFNNLLSIVTLNSEFLEDEFSDNEKARPWLTMIRQAVDRASSLTYRLMAFSRQQVLSPAPTDIGALLHDLSELLKRTLGETVRLEIRRNADLWPAKIDQNQLENALINLALNARDAMPDGGVLEMAVTNFVVDEAFVDQRTEIAPGDYVAITVSDTGTGMPPDIVEHMFEPFFTTKEVGKGSGLGLSMVYGFVMQSKGFVTVDSAPGDGTTVKLCLPRAGTADSESGIQGEASATTNN